MKVDNRKLNYPRPQLYRKNWTNLNGLWNFEFDSRNSGIRERWFEKRSLSQKITVPYVYQCKKSHINRRDLETIVWYQREIEVEKQVGKELILHFEAVDYEMKLWINGNFVGEHQGGHVPFSFNITPHIVNGCNNVSIRVEDDNSCSQPIGKQSWKGENFLCWYTRSVGIWQTVWIEEIDSVAIKELKIVPNVTNSHIEVEALIYPSQKESYLDVEIFFQGEFIRKGGVSVRNNRAKLSIDVSSEQPHFRVHYWTPETPHLYDMRLTLKEGEQVFDSVESYFGMRSVEVEGGEILLNNQKFFQRLILDQGYYSDGLLTGTPDEFLDDLKKVKEMGFNGVRKHQKIEDRRYMYLCDVLGLVMWAEMPSSFEYSYTAIENCIHEVKGMVKKHWNHPSVIVYTVMNESWGVNEIYSNEEQQNFVNGMYHLVKALDSSRLIIGNDGWEHTKTDILSVHDYNSDHEALFKQWEKRDEAVNGAPSLTSCRSNFCKNYSYRGEPVIISEYGGVAYSKEHLESWGYGDRLDDSRKVLERIEKLTESLYKIEYLAGFCYTQLADVEQEVNGLLDKNHGYKFDPKEIAKIVNRKKEGFTFQ